VDDSYHSWRVPSKWKRVQRGAKKISKGSKGRAPCIDCIITRACMYAECRNGKRYLLYIITIARMNVAMYIIIIGMNVVANLNSV
jgi:hypothetical protein